MKLISKAVLVVSSLSLMSLQALADVGAPIIPPGQLPSLPLPSAAVPVALGIGVLLVRKMVRK